MNKEYIALITEKIKLPATFKEALDAYIAQHEGVVDSLLGQIEADGGRMNQLVAEMKRRKEQKYMLALAVLLALSEQTYAQYRKRAIPDSIFYDTMWDITVWCENCYAKNHEMGVSEVMWLQNHLQPNLFRLGRLQFQLNQFYLPFFVPFKQRRLSPLPVGKKCVFVHIPQGEPLEDARCGASLQQANAFFATYFPEYTYQYYITESWLLYGRNQYVLPEGSNILKFAARFTIIRSESNQSQAIERIFGEKKDNLDDYPEETSLQLNTKKYMKNKGKLGIALGYINKDII